MSEFWKHYEAAKPPVASAVDDVRHKLVEEGWFGRQVTGDIAPQPKPEAAEEPPRAHNHATLYAEVWGQEPAAKDIYGAAATASAPAIEPPKQDKGLEPDF